MIDIQLNLETETAKFVTAPIFKAGTTVAVRITLAADPGNAPVLELALSPQSNPPQVKCYLATFAADSETVFLADWNTNDPRLLGFVNNKDSVPMNLAVRWTRAGKSREVPNLPVTVQQITITGPETSETGPSFLTEAQVLEAIAGKANSDDPRFAALQNGEGINFIVVDITGDNALTNGANLLAAYSAAKLLTPNGAALSATNRAAVLISPATYNLGSAEDVTYLTLNTQYVDLIGIGHRDLVRITSAGRTVAQTANDVHIAHCTLLTSSQSPNREEKAYYPESNLTLAKMTDVACFGPELSDKGHRAGINFAGTYINCVTDAGFGHGDAGTFSGLAIDCEATEEQNSFGCGGISGRMIRCRSAGGGFGSFLATISGTLEHCSASGLFSYAFGGSSGEIVSPARLLFCRMAGQDGFPTRGTGAFALRCFKDFTEVHDT